MLMIILSACSKGGEGGMKTLWSKTKYFTFSETNVFSFYWRTDNGKEEMVVRKMTESKQPLNCDDKTSSDSR